MIVRVVLCLVAGGYLLLGSSHLLNAAGVGSEGNGLRHSYVVFGSLFLLVAVIAALATALANKSRAWLILAAAVLALGLPVAFFDAFAIDMEKGEMHRRQFETEMHSGRYSFGDQPSLLAVAQAIAANDQGAIRAAAKAVPDLQAA